MNAFTSSSTWTAASKFRVPTLARISAGQYFGGSGGPVWVESLKSLLFSDLADDTIVVVSVTFLAIDLAIDLAFGKIGCQLSQRIGALNISARFFSTRFHLSPGLLSRGE
jgi:hypothetical protein